MKKFFTKDTPVTPEALGLIAHLPTPSLDVLVDPSFWQKLDDAHFMSLAVLLARKSFDEGGCPIGAVITDNKTGAVVGKGHNTLVQENHPYNHGETAAIRDAGRIDFSRTTIYTSLSPCEVCATLMCMRGFRRVVIGDVTNACGTEGMLGSRGVKVDVLENEEGVELYRKYKQEHPELDLEDWQGKAAVCNGR